MANAMINEKFMHMQHQAIIGSPLPMPAPASAPASTSIMSSSSSSSNPGLQAVKHPWQQIMTSSSSCSAATTVAGATTAINSTNLNSSNQGRSVSTTVVDTRDPSSNATSQRKYKAVNFDLPPTKRARRTSDGNDGPGGVNNVHNVISAIQTCVSTTDRLNAIYSACSKFDHDIQAAHDTEIAMGADIALFKHLPLLFIKKQRCISTKGSNNNSSNSNNIPYNDEEYVSIIEEISNTFTALEMLLRCSAESISTCYARIGDELFTFLIDIVQDLCRDLKSISSTIDDGGDDPRDNSGGDCSGTTTNTTSVGGKKGRTSSSSLISEEKVIQYDDNNVDDDGHHTSSGSSTTTGEDELEQHHHDQQQQQRQLKRSNSNIDQASSTSSTQASSNFLLASKVILRTTTKIIAHFGRVGSLTEALANTPKLLDTLCTVISMNKGNGYNHESNTIPIEARLNCLWIIANLACSAENMVLMARHERITEHLFEILSHPTQGDESTLCKDIDEFICLIRMRSVAVRAILNLSWAQENKIPFSENVDLVESILRIASHRKSPWCGSGKGVSGILLQSRRHACGTIRNIAAAPRKYKRRLCRLKNGKFLNVLADIAKHDRDSEVQEKILATLFNLVSADTAKMFTEKKEVLNVIIAAATAGGRDHDNDQNSNNFDNNNSNSSSRKMAENILRSLEKALPEDDEGYDALRPALSRFDSQIAMNRSISNFGSVNRGGSTSNFGSVSNFGNLPSMSNFSLGDINVSFSHSTLNPETV